MATFRLRAFLVLLTFGLGANTAWSDQRASANSVTESQSNAPEVGAAEPEQITGAASNELPSIMHEEDIPAYLRTDPCDTGDS